MFAFSTPIFKHLVRRTSFRLMSRSVFDNKSSRYEAAEDNILDNGMELEDFLESEKYKIPKNKEDVIEVGEYKLPRDITRKGIKFTCECINDMKNPDDRQWKDLTEKLTRLNITNVNTKILQACLRGGKIDFGISYYDYLVKEGQQLSLLDILFFSKLLSKKKSEIPKYEDTITNLYSDVKDYLFTSPLIRSFIIEIFVEIPTCFLDIIKNRDDTVEGHTTGQSHIVRKALELDMIDVAEYYLGYGDLCTSEAFIEGYINYCIRQVKKGKFSIDLINDLVEISERNAVIWCHKDLSSYLYSLVNTLMEHQNEYQWSVHKCSLKTNKCLNCGLALATKFVSQAEYEKLKDYFLKNVFIKNNIFLSSTEEEVEAFLNFLKTCPPYDIVLDGLNLMYRNRKFGIHLSNTCLKYFLEKDFRVLTIGRRHSRAVLTSGSFLRLKKNREKALFFFTKNLSEDDLFVLYSALVRNVDFVSGDFLSTYMKHLTGDLKHIFWRWKISHQYSVNIDREIIPPYHHCGLSQLTRAPTKGNDSYVWHISQQVDPRLVTCSASPLNWYCLQAKKREKNKTSIVMRLASEELK